MSDTLCEVTTHIFEVEEDAPTPRDRTCDCGEFTWGWMDDQLMLTEMWEATA